MIHQEAPADGDAPRSSAAATDLVLALQGAMGDDCVSIDPTDLARYETGWRYGHGKARLVVKPRTTEHVAAAVRICRDAGVRIQPVGANTGLVAASTPDESGEMVVLSLERLSRIVSVDHGNGSATVEGGVLLSQLNGALADDGRVFPIDLGADPQIGGMIATNTGGSRLVRYGDVRANLLGVEVVLPTGEIWSDLKGLRKNNTGLDAKQLFVGTSGAFGIVTGAVLKTWPLPKQRTGALACATSGEAVLSLLARLEPALGEFLTAFEAISATAVSAVLKHGAIDRSPYDGAPPAYSVLIELSSAVPSETLDLEELLGAALMEHMEAAEGDVDDVVVGDVKDFWHVRHQVSECLREEGTVLGLDVSVPRSSMAAFTSDVRTRLAESHPFVSVADFGHWGDGGSHLNLVWDPAAAPEGTKRALQREIYGLCVKTYGGSYSAEHGVGPHNIDAYHEYTSAYVREVCAKVAPERFGTVDL